jgi:hypothetical protein
VTYYTMFVIELQSRRVQVVGATPYPDEAFVLQAMRHLTDGVGVLGHGRVLLCDRDPKWSGEVVAFLGREGVRIVVRASRVGSNRRCTGSVLSTEGRRECADVRVDDGPRLYLWGAPSERFTPIRPVE